MYFKIHIRPEWNVDTVSALNITLKMDMPVKKGDLFLARIREIVKIPFCPFEGLRFSDEKGELPFTEGEGKAEMSFIYRNFYRAERDAFGEITASYRIFPRVQPEGYRSSPYFDLVAEKGGVNGGGVTFLFHPVNILLASDITVSWDLSGLPEDSHAVWSFGNSGREDILPSHKISDLLFSVYMIGKVRAAEEGSAGFYWFDTLPFDAESGAETITNMFTYMAKMFHDGGGSYRVFTRHNHFVGGGGTAMTRSYLFGYGDGGDQITLSGLQDLLAHEMVHNWPHIDDSEAGSGTWYVEGSAEYYSTMIPFEMGLRDAEATAAVINEKAGSYYRNPLMNMDNMSLGKIYWKDRHAQRVPYARGILYLANTDAAIRRSTKGKKSLLDLELALLKLPSPTSEDFVRIGSKIAGFDLRPSYEKMCAGGMIEPDPEAFGGKFKAVKTTVREEWKVHSVDSSVPGKEVTGYVWSVK